MFSPFSSLTCTCVCANTPIAKRKRHPSYVFFFSDQGFQSRVTVPIRSCSCRNPPELKERKKKERKHGNTKPRLKFHNISIFFSFRLKRSLYIFVLSCRNCKVQRITNDNLGSEKLIVSYSILAVSTSVSPPKKKTCATVVHYLSSLPLPNSDCCVFTSSLTQSPLLIKVGSAVVRERETSFLHNVNYL